MIGPVIAERILEHVYYRDPSEMELDDQIPLPEVASGTSTTSTQTIRLGRAAFNMLSTQDPRSATALVQLLGLADLDQFAAERGLRETRVRVPPGCDTIDQASETSLLDQALIYELSRYCYANTTPKMKEWLIGRGEDPDGVRAILDEMITAQTAAFTSTASARFRTEAEVMYTSSELDDGGVVRRALAGRLRIPRCAGGAIDFSVHSFGFYLEGEGDDATAQAAITAVKEEIMRAPLIRGIATGSSCYEQ
jgi:hypothetical protein